jgi:hypothetical protein
LKKSIVRAAVFMAVALTAFAVERPYKRFDLNLSVGYAKALIDGSSLAQSHWSMGAFSNIQDETIIKAKANAGWLAAGSLSYYFGRQIGLQVQVGSAANEAPPSSAFFFSFTRAGVSTTHRETWRGSGSFRTLPLSLNLVIGRLGWTHFQMSVSGGATYFMNSFEAAGFGGVSIYRAWSDLLPGGGLLLHEAVDAIKIPMTIDKTAWNAFGGNIGAMATFRLSDAAGLFVEARYFYCPQKFFFWGWTPGTYPGLYQALDAVTYPEDWALIQSSRTSEFTLNPSFYYAGAGILISF